MPAVPSIDDLDIAWVSRELGLAATSLSVTSVGSGQVANCYRLRLHHDDGRETTIIAKVPSDDEVSRATARVQHLYEREVSFYQELAPLLATRTPRCDYARRDDEGGFLLVLEDLGPRSSLDQFTGVTLDIARSALVALAGLHGPTHRRADLHEAPWLGGVAADLRPLYAAVIPLLFDQFLERHGERIDEATRETVTALKDRMAPFSDYQAPQPSVTHGDFRTDNLLVGERDGEVEVAVVDWQTVGVGSPLLDVAYFLTTSLAPEDCAAHEEELLAFYLEQLRRHGVDYPVALARHEYARYTLQPVVMLVCASVLVEQTERGDQMFLTMIERGVLAATRWRALDEVERHAAGQ